MLSYSERNFFVIYFLPFGKYMSRVILPELSRVRWHVQYFYSDSEKLDSCLRRSREWIPNTRARCYKMKSISINVFPERVFCRNQITDPSSKITFCRKGEKEWISKGVGTNCWYWNMYISSSLHLYPYNHYKWKPMELLENRCSDERTVSHRE